MKSKTIFEIIAFAGICMIGSMQVAVAQTPVSMKLDLVAWGPDIPNLTLKGGSKNNAVTALAFRYSKPVSYSGPNVVEIYQSEVVAEEPRLDGNGKEITRKQIRERTEAVPAEVAKQRKDKPGLVAVVSLPTNAKRATVLLAPTKDGAYRSWVINDDPAKLPLGKVLVHNYTPMPVALNFNGKAAKEFKPNESFLVDSQNNQLVYELAYKENGAWTVQGNNMFAVPADEQTQLIVLKSDEDFFRSGNGNRMGFLQAVVLRRGKDAPEENPTP